MKKLNFKGRIARKVGLVAAASALAIGGIVGASMPAQAATLVQPIDQLNTSGSHGYLSGQINWLSSTGFTLSGSLVDSDADGHGPYLHVFASYRDGSRDVYSSGRLAACDIHNTNGSGSSVSVSGCAGIDSPNIYAVSVWVCNGGDAGGYAQGGCYGRVYFNKQMDTRGSLSLGTVTQAYAYTENVV